MGDADPFGNNETASPSPPPGSNGTSSNKKQMKCSSSNNHSKAKSSTNKKHQLVSRSIDMLIQSIGNASTAAAPVPASSIGRMFFSVQMLQQQQSLQMQVLWQEQKFESELIAARIKAFKESPSSNNKLLQKILKN